jgi:hypothetical protein
MPLVRYSNGTKASYSLCEFIFNIISILRDEYYGYLKKSDSIIKKTNTNQYLKVSFLIEPRQFLPKGYLK